MSLWKSGIFVTLLTLLGRLSGFGRDFTISYISGANNDTDIAFLILTLPDLIINIILAGGLTTTIIPKLETLNKKDKRLIAGQILILIALIFIFISILISLNSRKIIYLLAPGINYLDQTNNILPLIIISFILPICALSGVVNSILNSKNIFFPGAIGSTILNISMIIFAVIGSFFYKFSIIWSLILGFISGAIIRFIFQYCYAYKFIIIRLFSSKNLLNIGLFKNFIGNFGFTTAIILMPIISRSFASNFDSGSLSLFTYSYKLIQLPLGVLMGSFSTVLLPYLSKKIRPKEVKKIIKRVFLISLSLGLAGSLLCPLIINLIFNKSNLTDFQLLQLGEMSAVGFLFLMPMSIVTLYGIIYAAKRNTLPLLSAGFIMLAGTLIISPFLTDIWGLNGIIASYGFSYTFGALFMFLWDNNQINFNKKLATKNS